MPATPYAQLLVAINGGAPTSGGLTIASGSAIQLSGQSTVGWTQQTFAITDYPVGFAQPAGWSTNPTTGAYFYASSAIPPPFTPNVWGKYMLSLTVNNGLLDGAVSPTLTDTSTALSIPSPTAGLLDLGFGEDLQFSPLKMWTGDQKKNLRALDGYLATVGGNNQVVLSALVGATGAPFPGPSGFAVIQPSTDFPLATHCKLYMTLWCDTATAPSSWSSSGTYTAGQFVLNGGVVYICTTGGTETGSGAGPSGFGTGLVGSPGSAVRWRSQTATVEILIGNGAGSSVIYTATVSITTNGAIAAGNMGLLELTADLSSALMSLPVRTLIALALGGDPADTGSPKYTTGVSGGARLIFT
jgi:hypothetical protein